MTETEMKHAERIMPILPRTKDGAPVVPGVDRVWRVLDDGAIVKRMATLDYAGGDYSSLSLAEAAGGRLKDGR